MRLHLRAVRLLPLLLPILLLPMGEAFGQCTPSPQPLGVFPNTGTQILEMAAVGSKLILAVRDGANGLGVWVSDDGQSVRPIGPVNGSPAWPASVLHFGKFTVLNGQVFFVVEDEFSSFLWVTDPSLTSYSLVGPGPFFDYVFDNGDFTTLGNWMYFRGKLGSANSSTLWRSDGTRLEAIKDINGNDVIEPTALAAVGNQLFFAAQVGSESELWKFDPASGLASLFQDLLMDGSSSPTSLTAVGSTLFFTATAAAGENKSLWVRRENEPAEVVVTSSQLGDSHGDLMELTAVGDKLFFHVDDQAQLGDELWVSDGTVANTHILQIQDPGSSAPSRLTAVGNMLFFIANDGSSGREPWKSDGTVAGTRMVGEFLAGSGDSSEEPELKAGPGVLLLSIYGTTSGKELWSVSDTASVQLTDFGNGTVSSTPHAMTILGNRVYFAASPSGNDDDLYWLPLNQVDCQAPSVTCPGPLQIEAVSPQGAYVFIPPPVQMSDDSFTPLTVTYSPGLFSLFEVDNSAPATITVTDMAGNSTQCPVTVNVRDTRGPELVCPEHLIVEATFPEGAYVFYPVAAFDAVSDVASVTATPSSGSRIQPGQTVQARVTAEDGRGNVSECEFDITVKDTQPPKLICPQDIVQVAKSAPPIPVAYEPIPAEDPSGATVEEDPRHRSGSDFNLGRTDVTLTAVDSLSHSSQCTFSVYVVDPVPPTITCPEPQQAVATGPEGAAVEFPEASAEDALGPPTLRYSAESGSTFPVGETTVIATATDLGSNEASCSFTVTVTASGQGVPPTGCACRAGSASASVYWLLLALAPLWVRRRIGRLAR